MGKSRYFNQNILFISLCCLLVGALYYFFFFNKPKSIQQILKNPENKVINDLNSNPDFLLTIQPENLPEYFRERLIYFENTVCSNTDCEEGNKHPYIALENEIKKKYPAETGRVIIEILKTYKVFNEGKKILKEQFVNEYDYLIQLKKFRGELFGANFDQQIFPPYPGEKITLFYAYAEKYLQENPNLTTRIKKIHLEKKRQEIYGIDFENLVFRQTFAQEFSLQKKIIKRELDIMNPHEKAKAIEEIREKLSP